MLDKPDRPLEYPFIALDAKRAAAANSISLALWYQLDSAGKIPQAVRLNSKRLWPVKILELWCLHGCPARDSATWQAILAKFREDKT